MFDSGSKGTGSATSHISREFAWFGKVDLEKDNWISVFMSNLSGPDHKEMEDKLE